MPWTKVYINKTEFEHTLAKEGLRGKSYREAIWEAQVQLLRQDKRVFLLGEGVTDPGGIFGSTSGLVQEFGKDRVLDIPIAENGLTGVAIGAALAGMRPIFVHMRMDFLPMCMDQIVNHAAKWHYMTGGRVNVPLVIRSIIGRGWGSAAQHSQALHGLFMHIPGLKVVMPSTPYDAKGLLISAVQDGNPVLFVEAPLAVFKIMTLTNGRRWFVTLSVTTPRIPTSCASEGSTNVQCRTINANRRYLVEDAISD